MTTRQRLKLLVWPTLLAIFFGVIGFGELLEDAMRIARNKIHEQPASGQIVLVQIDEPSLRAVGDWPWPRAKQAELVSKLSELKPKRIVMDVLYSGPSTEADDEAFEQALANAHNVTLAAQTRVGDGRGTIRRVLPYEPFRQHSSVAAIAIPYNWQLVAWDLPYTSSIEGAEFPSLASAMAGIGLEQRGTLAIDYSFDLDSIPIISAAKIFDGSVATDSLAGKTVVVGANSAIIGDQYRIPGYGKRGGVLVQIYGAETILAGGSIDLGWIPMFLLAAGAAVFAILYKRGRYLAGAAAGVMVAPVAIEHFRIFVDVTPALFLLAVVAGRMVWRRSRQRGLINSISGLPNLTALGADKSGKGKPLVAARVHNYAEIVSTLDDAGEKKLVKQIVQRLSLGDGSRAVYQGDEGIFAWFAEKGTPFSSQLEAQHALFRSPVKVADIAYDVALSFGVELGSSRSITSRLGSALVAADEADQESLKWKYHDPARMEEVPWRLSLLSQLDEAIDKGEVWLAYQPKLDLKTRKTVGAEALARWTHPQKGPISPAEFVTAAEQSDRISYLTDFVLNQAIEAAARLNKDGHEIDMAVNLSARMLNDPELPERVAAFLARHGLKPERLVLELTETAAVSGSGQGIELLVRLRDLGVKIAIDDYGTGLSTLDYLKKVPASELKIDQTFVKSMRDNRSDLIMVQSTITLAHSLGRIVVAEGVEDPASLDQLKSMGCDQAQGFIIGRPMGFEEMQRRLATEKRRSAAA